MLKRKVTQRCVETGNLLNLFSSQKILEIKGVLDDIIAKHGENCLFEVVSYNDYGAEYLLYVIETESDEAYNKRVAKWNVDAPKRKAAREKAKTKVKTEKVMELKKLENRLKQLKKELGKNLETNVVA